MLRSKYIFFEHIKIETFHSTQSLELYPNLKSLEPWITLGFNIVES
jgi:hypothetical protein